MANELLCGLGNRLDLAPQGLEALDAGLAAPAAYPLAVAGLVAWADPHPASAARTARTRILRIFMPPIMS